MGTGHRTVHNPEAVRRALRDLIVNVVQPDAVRSGGAEGFDTLLAEAAIEADVPLLVDLPNYYYRQRHPDAISDRLLKKATEVRYIVNRNAHGDWYDRWGTERWWLDSHTRNHAMANDSDIAVVGSELFPIDLATGKGGTAECVRYLLRHTMQTGVWWLPLHRPAHEWVPIARQGALL